MRFDRKTQCQAVFRNEFDFGWRKIGVTDLKRQKSRVRGWSETGLIFFDPVFDGLGRATELPGDLGDGAMMVENLFGGVTLNVGGIA